MSQAQLTLAPSLNIDLPICPICQSGMMLTRIEPEKPDHDRRSYECQKCDHSESVVVKFK